MVKLVKIVKIEAIFWQYSCYFLGRIHGYSVVYVFDDCRCWSSGAIRRDVVVWNRVLLCPCHSTSFAIELYQDCIEREKRAEERK